MATDQFIDRGGSEPEFRVYKALMSTGRREPRDFIFKPPSDFTLSFLIASPRVGIRVGGFGDGRDQLFSQQAGADARVETIQESRALSDARGALTQVLGG